MTHDAAEPGQDHVIKRIAVIGGGAMGRGIAHATAAAGIAVAIVDISTAQTGRAIAEIERLTARDVEKGRLSASQRQTLLACITRAASLEEAAAQADIVVECVPEDVGLKQEVFRQLDRCSDSTTILASNTSALSISAIAKGISSPDRAIGLHFFNPVMRMPLIEIVRGIATSPETIRASISFANALGKETIVVEEYPGFATSRMNVLIGNEAFRMLMEGVASAEDIDRAMTLGLRHPMGPLELVDLVGLDVRLSVLRHLHSTLGERFRPSPLLTRLVEAGRLGRKTGQGVYRYDDQGIRIPGSA